MKFIEYLYPKNTAIQYAIEFLFFGNHPHDCLAHWDLQLIVGAAQQHQRLSYHIFLVWERFKTQSMVSTKYIWHSYHHKIK
jgi:hypothetical protein